MVCLGITVLRKHMHHKKKRAALNEEAMQSDSSCEMPGAKDLEHSPMRSIEPRPLTCGGGNDDYFSRRLPSEQQKLEVLQGAADTIVNVKATDLLESSSGQLREFAPASRPDGNEPPRIHVATGLPEAATRNLLQHIELESAAVGYEQKPPQSSHSNYRDVFVDAPEKLTPRNSTDAGRRLAELAT
ncbi:hypothetical protein PG996_002655 [Apiospora saccharicola]|uniref:Uncharacterized protein n=1 Tax=Apiospora saccharicola TaxID=335842 RepID=A0ABR1WK33_9PEZI